MVTCRLEHKEAFDYAGEKVFITGQDNEQFSAFWAKANQNGLIDRLRALRKDVPGPVTNSHVFGVSRVEADPANRAFDFWIATEIDAPCDMPQARVPAGLWAVFTNDRTVGGLGQILLEEELYAMRLWLPASEYAHAARPELEVYPVTGYPVEFWLPIVKKEDEKR